MFGIGLPELVIILVVALIVFGPKKLPELAKALGRGMSEFKKASEEIKDSLNLNEELREVKNDLDDSVRGVEKSLESAAQETKGEEALKAELPHETPDSAQAPQGVGGLEREAEVHTPEPEKQRDEPK